MQKEVREAFRVHFKWTVLEFAKVCRTVAKACREFEVPRSTFYNWKRAFDKEGKAGLFRKEPIARNHPRSLTQDVKFVSLRNFEGNRVRRFQYTATDDATRIRAMKIYPRHNQQNAIKFIDYVIEKFPFRFHTIRTDRGHEFQAQFHWHVEDRSMRHVYIKPRSPQLNGKVERSHRTDQEEFYQLLTYTDDVDLNKKLAVWERFYNLDRPHGAFKGKTPYEALRGMLE
jgi:transposase-like protein